MISHFQGWKNFYYSFTTRPPSLDTHSLLLTQTGSIPLRIHSLGNSLPTMNEVLTLHHEVSLSEIRTKNHKKIFFGDECNGLYCREYNSNLQSCVAYITCDDITYFQTGNTADSTKVTLVVVGNEDSISSGAIDQTLNSWLGEKVVVIQSEANSLTTDFISRVTKTSSYQMKSFDQRPPKFESIRLLNDSYPLPSICVVLVSTGGSSLPLLDKTLFNIGMDIASTESVLLTHPGYHFPQHLDSYLENQLKSSPLSAIIIPSFLSNSVGQLYQMSKGNLNKLCGFENQPDSLLLKSSQIEQLKKSYQLLPIFWNSTEKVRFSLIHLPRHIVV